MKSILPIFAWFLVLGLLPGALRAEVIRLQPAPSPADNPLKGLVPYQGQGGDCFPHSLEFSYLSLDQLMTGRATFNWEPMEALLNDVASRGHQTIFGIWLEYPNSKSGVPRYLSDGGVKIVAWEERDGGKTVKHFTPNDEDERLVAALEIFLINLGRRYDGDPRIGYITAGLLGAWGEWHCYPREDLFASPGTQQRILAAYEKAFRKTSVLLRYPIGTGDPKHVPNAQLPMGYHDDSFAWGTLKGGKGASGSTSPS